MIGDVRYTEPLKRQYNRRYYAFHIFKIVTNIGHSIKIEEALKKSPVLGSIHQRKSYLNVLILKKVLNLMNIVKSLLCNAFGE